MLSLLQQLQPFQLLLLLSLHEHLFTSGFMPNYICWTKHREISVIMEEDEEEEGDDDNMIIHGFA